MSKADSIMNLWRQLDRHIMSGQQKDKTNNNSNKNKNKKPKMIATQVGTMVFIWFWPGLQLCTYIFSVEWFLNSIKTQTDGYPHNRLAIIATVYISYLKGQYVACRIHSWVRVLMTFLSSSLHRWHLSILEKLAIRQETSSPVLAWLFYILQLNIWYHHQYTLLFYKHDWQLIFIVNVTLLRVT